MWGEGEKYHFQKGKVINIVFGPYYRPLVPPPGPGGHVSVGVTSQKPVPGAHVPGTVAISSPTPGTGEYIAITSQPPGPGGTCNRQSRPIPPPGLGVHVPSTAAITSPPGPGGHVPGRVALYDHLVREDMCQTHQL